MPAIGQAAAEPSRTETRSRAGARAGARERDRLLARLAASAASRGARIAYDLLGSRAEAEDAVQEALARACESYHRLREPAAAEGWFFRILTNVCLRTLRRRKLKRLLLGRGPSPASAASKPEDGVDRALVARRDVADLLGALDELPAKQRTALLLRYGHDLSVADIADMLGVKPATVKTHLVRGLRRLRKTMESLS